MTSHSVLPGPYREMPMPTPFNFSGMGDHYSRIHSLGNRFRKVASTSANNNENICSGPVLSRSEISYSHANKSVGFQGVGKLRADHLILLLQI